MKRSLTIVLLLLTIPGFTAAQPKTKRPAQIKYGSNLKAGEFFQHDGIKLYYEIYGVGEPLLLVHGNGGSIADLGAQIEHFRKRYKVIAMDSRDQGRSSDTPGKITYEKMTDDLAALLDHLKITQANILGWSDGGIEALLLALKYPTKVKKVAAMAANLNPSQEAIYPEVIDLVKSMISSVPKNERNKSENKRELKVTSMMLEEPDIDFKALEAITAPTLVLAGDHDLIRAEHTLKIFQTIPNSQLVIFPNATHMIPFDDPALFNSTVERFFRAPFVKKDRIQDTMKSLEKLRNGS